MKRWISHSIWVLGDCICNRSFDAVNAVSPWEAAKIDEKCALIRDVVVVTCCKILKSDAYHSRIGSSKPIGMIGTKIIYLRNCHQSRGGKQNWNRSIGYLCCLAAGDIT
ncbi:hypothetical protein WN943_020154 [Citrus x changshan-huyou]